ncbi:MAG: GxxExxY protein [Comamonadaceae bacterium]|nr:MAG: GxxExxY protein [Comamonadaceae bacterium]
MTASPTDRSAADDDFSHEIIGAAVEVQRVLGTGLPESVYAAALAVELNELELSFERDRPIEALYKGRSLGIAARADFLVEGSVLIVLKTAEGHVDAQRAQLLSSLRLSGVRLGLLINFQTFPVVKGIHRMESKP